MKMMSYMIILLIKLTGQSCKVEIFKDALKEFIPGRIIEVNKSRKEAKEEYELKLTCLKGALKYLYARNFGYADITIESKAPTLPYLSNSLYSYRRAKGIN